MLSNHCRPVVKYFIHQHITFSGQFFFQAAMKEPLNFLEDIYVTGICAQRCPRMARINAGGLEVHLNGYRSKGNGKFNPQKTWLVHGAKPEDFPVMRGQVT